jgi:hypothetical protein
MVTFTHIPRWLSISAAIVVACTAGCRMLNEGVSLHGQSPLKPPRSSPDSVAVEIRWVRFPEGDPLLNEEAWLAIDETQIPTEVRRELAANGFRVGIIAGTLPEAMARALQQKPSDSGSDQDSGNDQIREPIAQESAEAMATNGAEFRTLPTINSTLLDEPVVRGHIKQLRRHERWEIQASDVLKEMTVLEPNGTQLGGNTFTEAQAIYALRIDPQPDRTVFFELTPELHYGPFRPRWTSDDGVMLQTSMRDRKVFLKLQLNVRLSAGEMLVLMNLPNSGSRLGEHFHSVDSPQGRQQKLVLLRLAQTPPSEAFADER